MSGLGHTSYPTSAKDVAQQSSPGGDFAVQAAYNLHKVPPRMRLSGGTDSLPNCPTAGVLIQNLIGNDPIYVGGLGDDAAYHDLNYVGDNHGTIIYPGGSWVDPVDNSAKVTISGTKNQEVHITTFLNQPHDVTLDQTPLVAPLPPVLVSSNPSSGAIQVVNNPTISAIFSQALDPNTVNASIVTISPLIPSMVVTIDPVNPKQINMVLSGGLVASTLYTISFGTGLASAPPGDFTNPAPQTITFTTDSKPALVSSSPASGAAGVFNNPAVTATFGQTLDPTTVNLTNVTISPAPPGFTAIRDNINLAKINMTLSGGLPANTNYVITFHVGISGITGFATTSNQTINFTTDTVPTVISTTPANAATAQETNVPITILFSKPMDPTTISPIPSVSALSFVSASHQGVSVPYNAAFDNFAALTISCWINRTSTGIGFASYVHKGYPSIGWFSLQDDPSNNTFFNAGGVSTLTSNLAAANGVWHHILGVWDGSTVKLYINNILAQSAPAVDTVHALNAPLDFGTAVGSNWFNGKIDEVRIYNVALTTTEITQLFSGLDVVRGIKARFAFDEGSGSTTTDSINGLVGAFTNSPTFSSTSLAAPLTTVNLTPGIAKTKALLDSGNSSQMDIQQGSNLAFLTTYTGSVNVDALDTAGFGLASPFSFSFTTKNAPPPPVAPTVVSTTPASGATGVSPFTVVTIVFSEQMDGATITNTNITLKTTAGSVNQPWTVVLAPDLVTVACTPTAPSLATNTSFTITVSTAVKCTVALGALALASTFTRAFTTEPAPSVTQVTPANAATLVSIIVQPTLTFSVAMNASTITSTNIYVTNPGGTHLPAVLSLDGTFKIVTITLNSALLANTVYTVHALTGLQNQDNVPMASNFSSTFTTETAPVVSSTSPANSATNVVTSVAPTVTFNQAMNTSSITSSNVYLMDAGNNHLAASVTMDGTHKIATITPTTSLLHSAVYTINVTTGVQNASNIALVSSFSSQFSTGAISYTPRYNVSQGSTGSSSLSTSYYLGNQNGYVAYGEKADNTKSGQGLVGYVFTKFNFPEFNTHGGSLAGSLAVQIRDSNASLKYQFINTFDLTPYSGSNTPYRPSGGITIQDPSNTYAMANGDVIMLTWLNENSTNLEISTGPTSGAPYGRAVFWDGGSGSGSYHTRTSDDIAATIYSSP